MPTIADPAHRRASYLAAPLTAHSSQEKRRQLALEAQKQRRTHAIQAARASFRELDPMEDLSLDASSASEEEYAPAPPTAHSTPSPRGQAIVAKISKTKRKAYKPKFKSWAKNLLTYAETLDLRYSLPAGLENEWRAVVAPRGKRCLCATASDQAGNNTILYSRVAGRALGRFNTQLPSDCLLDAIWDPDLAILWILDLCKWRSTYFVECEAEMRAFFLSSKLAELPKQPYVPPTIEIPPGTTNTRPLLVLPAPSHAPPLTPSVLSPLLSALSGPSPPAQTIPVEVFFPSDPSDPTQLFPTLLDIPLHPTGLLFYLSHAHYESGSTPLVSWVSCSPNVERGMERGEGVERMRELVEEWAVRGGPAAVVVNEAGAGGSQEVSMNPFA
ncbi:snurportin-1 [Rhodotorula toruloides]|uniref:Snurportin-1 n=1 Tax=Rhodotorula toruloides TaxID=5286 RepID=A0A511KK35_RHOTO|nr:snurportin-1 [Rhodotorula toruloides]